MARLRIERNQETRRRNWRPANKRKAAVLTAAVAVGLGVLLAYQALKDLVEGNPVMGENYLGQPVKSRSGVTS